MCIMEVNEENFYPVISKWLRSSIGCQYTGERKILWGRQPDVLGVKFEVRGRLVALLHLIEVKVIDSLTSAYNLIGEMESRIASFHKENSIFYALYPYLGIYEAYDAREVRDYAENRRVGLISLKDDYALSLEKSPTPILSNKTLSIRDLNEQNWIKDEGEAKIFREAVKTIDWWMWRRIIEASNLTHTNRWS